MQAEGRGHDSAASISSLVRSILLLNLRCRPSVRPFRRYAVTTRRGRFCDELAVHEQRNGDRRRGLLKISW